LEVRLIIYSSRENNSLTQWGEETATLSVAQAMAGAPLIPPTVLGPSIKTLRKC